MLGNVPIKTAARLMQKVKCLCVWACVVARYRSAWLFTPAVKELGLSYQPGKVC